MKALMKKTDHELINFFVDGNLEALEILVLRHKDKLYTSILFLVKDKYLAEDIFQDVFIRIIDTMRSGRYTEEGKFLPWAMRIAHNLCVDYFRKVKRTPTIKNGDDKDIFEVLSFADDSGSISGGFSSEMVAADRHNILPTSIVGTSSVLNERPAFPLNAVSRFGSQTSPLSRALRVSASF